MCVDIILRHFLQTNAVVSVWLIARRHWRRFPWPWFLSRLDGADESHSWAPKGSWSGVTEMGREEKDTRGCTYEMERVQKQAGGWNVEREDQGKDVGTREQTEAQEGKYIEQRRWMWRLSGEMRGVRASGVRVHAGERTSHLFHFLLSLQSIWLSRSWLTHHGGSQPFAAVSRLSFLSFHCSPKHLSFSFQVV